VHKLLFDNNISHRVLKNIDSIFPNSSHVMIENLDESSDIEVWQFAKKNNFTIVTKDSDFNDLSVIKGFPPKIIWIRVGNCKVLDIVDILKNNEKEIKDFIENKTDTILEIQ